jgi:predicted TIM-barrel fold metal-dependent hydrolase
MLGSVDGVTWPASADGVSLPREISIMNAPYADRRTFLQGSLQAAAALALGRTAAAETAPDAGENAMRDEGPIVDTHLHLWDLTRFELPWTKGNKTLGRSFLMEDYERAIAGLPVVKAVYMEVDVRPDQQLDEAHAMAALSEEGKTVMKAAVVSGRPASPDFPAYLEKISARRAIKGMRQILHGGETPAGFCTQQEFIRGVQLLGEAGLSFDLCMRAGELLDGVKLVDACPKTRFIVDHCGNMPVTSTDAGLREKWRKGIREFAQRERVVCKISGIVASAAENWKPADLAPIVNEVLEAFGPDRVMFAGDWPVCTLRASFRQWVEALQEIVAQRPLAERRKLFHDNAVKFYGL